MAVAPALTTGMPKTTTAMASAASSPANAAM